MRLGALGPGFELGCPSARRHGSSRPEFRRGWGTRGGVWPGCPHSACGASGRASGEGRSTWPRPGLWLCEVTPLGLAAKAPPPLIRMYTRPGGPWVRGPMSEGHGPYTSLQSPVHPQPPAGWLGLGPCLGLVPGPGLGLRLEPGPVPGLGLVPRTGLEFGLGCNKPGLRGQSPTGQFSI